jgi:hypothetical protein
MRRLVARRESDELMPAEAPLLSKHLLSCPACSAESIRRDPTLLFTSLSASAVELASPSDDFEIHRLAAGTLAAIERSERVRLRAPSRRPVLQAASVVLLAGALLVFLAARDRIASKKGPVSDPGAPDATTVVASPLRGEPGVVQPLIEELVNPGARVYQFAAASPKEPSVVFVANPNADL